MAVVIIVLFIVGLVCGIVEAVQSQGRSLPGWGLIAIAAGLLLSRLA